MATYEDDERTVTFDDSQEAKDRAFTMLLAFFTKHDAYSGESIQQMDGPQIDAPNILTRLAEKAFKFKVKWKDD